MEPTTLTAAAIATLVITKAFEKTGEKLGEKVLEEGGKLLSLLKHKEPSTATAIEKAQQQPLDYGQAVLERVETAANANPEIAQTVKDVEAAAKADPKFLQAVQALENAVKLQASTVHNYGKLAQEIEKIANVYQGNISIDNQNQTFNF